MYGVFSRKLEVQQSKKRSSSSSRANKEETNRESVDALKEEARRLQRENSQLAVRIANNNANKENYERFVQSQESYRNGIQASINDLNSFNSHKSPDFEHQQATQLNEQERLFLEEVSGFKVAEVRNHQSSGLEYLVKVAV